MFTLKFDKGFFTLLFSYVICLHMTMVLGDQEYNAQMVDVEGDLDILG